MKNLRSLLVLGITILTLSSCTDESTFRLTIVNNHIEPVAIYSDLDLENLEYIRDIAVGQTVDMGMYNQNTLYYFAAYENDNNGFLVDDIFITVVDRDEFIWTIE